MSTVTLVAKRLYFGMPALRLRDATERVLTRIGGEVPEGAAVGIDVLAEEFRLDAGASRLLADKMVRLGLLERMAPQAFEFRLTSKFRQYAEARIVEALPRTRAQLLLGHFADLAEQFNRTAAGNKYEIDAIAVFGTYMSRESELPELSIGVTGRHRAPGERGVAGRATTHTEGTEDIRRLFESQSTLVRVSFFQKLQDVPRPFSVVFRDDG